MRTTKEKVIQMIQRLPDEVTLDDIFSELYFKLQVDSGLREVMAKVFHIKRSRRAWRNGLPNKVGTKSAAGELGR